MERPPPASESPPLIVPEELWKTLVRRHLQGLRYGHLRLVVNNGQVVQFERLERIRLVDLEPEFAI